MPGPRLIACAVLAAVVQQFPPPPPSGLIVGQVVDAGTGRPVAGAVVTISAPPAVRRPFGPASEPAPPPPRILTGTDGQFVFRDLPRANYTITALRNGYADGAYGRRRPGGPSRPLTLGEGERAGDVVLHMWRYGAITGTVVDEAGEPSVGLTIRAWRSSVVAGRRRFGGGMTSITDDRGIYRIGNLVPGEYLVTAPVRNVAMPIDLVMERVRVQGGQAMLEARIASERPGGSSVIQVRDSALLLNRGAVPAVANDGRLFVYPTTYYPSATAAAQATPVTVGSGEERTAIDFQLQPLPTATVSGTVIGPDGPRAGTPVQMWPTEAEDVFIDQDGLTTTTRSNGNFQFPAVPTGNYVIRIAIRPPTPGGPARRGPGGAAQYPLLWAEVPVSVGRSDVPDVVVTLTRGLRVAGRAEFEGVRRPAAMELQRVPVVLEPADGIANVASPPAVLEGAGNFMTSGNVPGRYFLRITNSPPGWMFKSAMLGGRDISDVPFDLTDDISGVVINFTNRWTGVQGSVRTAQGAPDPDATVVAFPAQSEAWTGYGVNPRRIKSARVTASGAYTVNSLPPGDYFVAAIPEDQSADWQEPGFLEALARTAKRVTVYDGEKATQDLVTREVR